MNLATALNTDKFAADKTAAEALREAETYQQWLMSHRTQQLLANLKEARDNRIAASETESLSASPIAAKVMTDTQHAAFINKVIKHLEHRTPIC